MAQAKNNKSETSKINVWNIAHQTGTPGRVPNSTWHKLLKIEKNDETESSRENGFRPNFNWKITIKQQQMVQLR